MNTDIQILLHEYHGSPWNLGVTLLATEFQNAGLTEYM